jgi:fibronectin-binding autotransporter adhesin
LTKWLNSLAASWKSRFFRSRRPQPRPARRGTRLVLEHLEDRRLLTSFSAASVSALIADINAANTAGGSNTISLTAPTTSHYVLTAVDNTTHGPTGLPVIAANDNLTILGNGDTIERSANAGFRLLGVAAGGSLTLQNLTLQGGEIDGLSSFSPAEGGAIFSQGALVLNAVIVQGNSAFGFNGVGAAGGGIFSSGGSVTLEGGTIVQNNSAVGGTDYGGYGGDAYGGGLYASGGTVTMTNAILDNNTARAGLGKQLFRQDGYADGGGLYASNATLTLTNVTLDGNVATLPESSDFGGGGAFGGGLYLSIDTATVTNCTVQGNSALAGGSNKYGSPGEGGGLFINYGDVTLDAATVKHLSGNTASSGAKYDNIVGPYTRT